MVPHLRSIDFHRTILLVCMVWNWKSGWKSRCEMKHIILVLAHRLFFNNTKHKKKHTQYSNRNS